MTGYIVSDALTQNIEHEKVAALLDPFAIRTFTLFTKYWTVAEKNSISAGLSGLLLWNRLIWIGVGVAFLILAYYRFSFSERRSKVRRIQDDSTPARSATAPTPASSWRSMMAEAP